MATDRYQLSDNAARAYETQKVGSIFRPLAEQTVEHAALRESDRVLDVACGTGIVLRVIGKRMPGIAGLVGVDLNRGMLKIARSLSAEEGVDCEWHQCDVTELPFDSAAFTLCCCQQGLQFFPDKPTALVEMHRVLGPGGRLLVSVWSELSPLFAAMGEALASNVSSEVAKRALAPFAFRDQQVIQDMLAAARFTLQKVQVLTLDRKLGPASESIPAEIAGSPVASDVDTLDPETRQQLISDISARLEPYRTAEGYKIPQSSYLFEATR